MFILLCFLLLSSASALPLWSLEMQEGSLTNKTLIVSTVLNSPFMMLKEGSEKLTGNDRYEGFSADLIKEVANILIFNYTIKEADDGRYGSFDKKTGTWNGMIGELQNQKADLVVADITITSEREQVLDFTMPFMTLGVTILHRKPTKKTPIPFSFLSPFVIDLWIYIITAYLAVSLLLFAISRFSPCERPVTCRGQPNDESVLNVPKFTCSGNQERSISTQANFEASETFTLMNSFWFVLAALLGQRGGVNLFPSAFSTRLIAALWWFFSLTLISSYTANLAAFLTVERLESPIQSVEELASQRKVQYGAVAGGSTEAFLRESENAVYARMWNHMDQNKHLLTRSTREGVDRVLRDQGAYAFMMESTAVEYVVERMCELRQVGGLLDNKGYGIGLPPDSPYRSPISSAILQLQEGGVLRRMKEKWWRLIGGGRCGETPDRGIASLSMQNISGIFLVLAAGLGLACVAAGVEYAWTREGSTGNTGNMRMGLQEAT